MLHLESELLLFRALYPPLKRVWIKSNAGHRLSKGRVIRVSIQEGRVVITVRRDGKKTSWAYPTSRIEVSNA